MSKPYDATIKDLAAEGPGDFIRIFDQPSAQPPRVLNVDLSTVTCAGWLEAAANSRLSTFSRSTSHA